jgi:Leucine-rich repeat (LRR) protein
LKYTSLTSLDSSVNLLGNLKKIDLSHSFIRNIDKNVYSGNLVFLNLSHTFMNPWEIEQIAASFPNLTQLDLSEANLRFLPNKMGNFNQLTYLNLSNNKLTHIPHELENFQNLIQLDLSNNTIQHPSTALGFLWKLEKLNISGNPKLDLNRTLTSISENKTLKELSIDGNSLSKTSSKLLSLLPITYLKINELNGGNSVYLKNIPTLRKLEINLFSGKNLENLSSKFTQIKHIVINNSILSEEILTSLNVDSLTLIGIDNINSGLFKFIKKINVLDLSQCFISKDELAQLKIKLPKTKIVSSNYAEYDYKTTNGKPGIASIPTKRILHNSSTPTIIQEKNATIEIPENAFLTKEGTIYNGNVAIDLKVYEDVIELALDGAPMSYYTNGNTELFGSNGMLYFNATTENGEQLQPNPSAIIDVEMRNNIPQSLGAMYRFDEEQQNWVELPNQATVSNGGIDVQRIVDSVNAIDASKLVQIVNNDRKYSLKIKAGRYDLPVLEFDSQFSELKNSKTQRVMYYNRFNETGKEICNHSWVIDTLIDKGTFTYLKQLQKDTRTRKKDLKNKYKPFFPKIIWNLSITQDYTSDNYRLKFKTRDSVISLPIALSSVSNDKTQRQHLAFQKKLKRAEKEDLKHKSSFDKFYENNVDKLAATIRKQIIQNTIENMKRNVGNTEIIRFGLTGFGLINCDIITRIPPEDYLVIGNELKDQYGNTLQAPEMVKVIMKAQNTYFPVGRNRVPLYNSSVIIALLNENKLGIFPNNSTSRQINTVRTFDIENLSSQEISQLILEQNEQN